MCLLSPSAASEQDHDDERGDPLDESGSHLRQEPAERSLSPLSRLQLRNLEQSFSVSLSAGRDAISVRGEESNVRRCVSSLEDMREETETTVALAPEELHALLAHEGKYRKAIEQAEHVFIALDGTSGVRVRGGAKAVASAVRSIQDLFRSGCLAGDSSQSRRSSL